MLMQPPPNIDLEQLFREPLTVIPSLVTIDIVNLENVMINHARLVAWAVIVYEEAKSLEASAKWDLDYMRSKAQAALFQNDPKLAMGKAEAMATSDISVSTQARKYQELQRKTSILKSLVSALEHRRDMIVQLAARQRQEIAGYQH